MVQPAEKHFHAYEHASFNSRIHSSEEHGYDERRAYVIVPLKCEIWVSTLKWYETQKCLLSVCIC